MAPWNLSTRSLSQKKGKLLVNGKYDLIFFHYSGFDSGANEAVFNYYVKDKENVIYELRNTYISEMNMHGQEKLGKHFWSYSCYESGEKIDNRTRILYRDNNYQDKIEINPFKLSNKHLNIMIDPNHEVFTIPSLGRRVIRKFFPYRFRVYLKKKLKK